MIRGVVGGLQALVSLEVIDAYGRPLSLEGIVDTGFAGYLTLPSDLIQKLQLRWTHRMYSRLAGNIPMLSEVYEATVHFRDVKERIEVLEMEDDILLGMSLLIGTEIRIQVEEGGLVEIEPL